MHSVSAAMDGGARELCARTADDRCQWQMKGGKPYAEREASANEVKRESAARCGSAYERKECIVAAG